MEAKLERKEVKLSLLADNMTLYTEKASLVAQIVKHLPAMQETWVRSLGCGDPWRRMPNCTRDCRENSAAKSV